jgi:hypothetical protein
MVQHQYSCQRIIQERLQNGNQNYHENSREGCSKQERRFQERQSACSQAMGVFVHRDQARRQSGPGLE